MLANLIASPFYGKLSARTLELIKLIQPPAANGENGDFAIIEPNWLHAMLAELRRIRYLLKWMLVLGIVSIIPGLNLLAPLFWGVFGAWGCALEFFAYPLENKGLLFLQQREVAGNMRLGALSFGGIILVGLGLPFVNLVVAPAAVIAATLFMYENGELAKATN
jgi:CysZ protein